jgi:colanic acid/amylovoran biosynthesis protein
MIRLLITNAYSARNRGDAAIVLGMLRGLRSQVTFSRAEIVVSSSDPRFDGPSYGIPVIPSLRALCAGVAPGPLLPELLFVLVVLPACLVWALAQRSVGVDLWLPGPLRRVLRSYSHTDLVVAAGGGYLYTTSGTRGNLVLLSTVLSFLLGRLLDKPVVLYAQSIGPFSSRIQAWLVRRALDRVQLIQVRERRSLTLLQGWKLRVPVVLATDAAFLIAAESPPGPSVCAGPASCVGVTVRHWFRDASRQLRYEQLLAAFVDWLIAEAKAQVVFVPQVTHALAGDDDRAVARRVVARLRQPGGAQLVEAELRPGQVKSLCGRMRFFLGTRMHSNLFASSMGVPVLAIGYLPKTSGLMEELGLAEWTLPIDTLELSSLQAAYGRLVGHESSVRSWLARRIPELERSALESAQAIEEYYLCWRAGRRAR